MNGHTIDSVEKGEKSGKIVPEHPSSVLKYWSLCVLITHHVGFLLVLRYSRTLPGDMYIASTAVVFAELLKLATCLFLTYMEVRNVRLWLKMLYMNILADPITTLKVAVPSFIYVIQNNLQFVAISNLDAATFQVTYQFKVLTTAVFSVLMLKKSLSGTQWISLLILFFGVAVVQLQPSLLGAKKSSTDNQRPIVGLIAVLISTSCSGFAGVYFEKILKGTGGASLWLRNIQLGLFGTILGLAVMMVNNGAEIREKGILFGYSNLVWFIIVMQALGGLLVAVVVKYADNILKCFATSLAIIVSCMLSIYFFNFTPSLQFIVGTGLVLFAVYLYGKPQNVSTSTHSHLHQPISVSITTATV